MPPRCLTQQLMWKVTGFYLQYSNLGGALRALQLGALLSHETQLFPRSPKGHKPKANPVVPHILILSWLHTQFSSPSGRYQSQHPHAAALFFGIWGTLSSGCVIAQKNKCHGALHHGEIQERTKSQESRWSPGLGQQGSRSVSCKARSLVASESARVGTIEAACLISYWPMAEQLLQPIWLLSHCRQPAGSYLHYQLDHGSSSSLLTPLPSL